MTGNTVYIKKPKGGCGQSCLCLWRRGVSRKVFEAGGGSRAHGAVMPRPACPASRAVSSPPRRAWGHPCVQPLLIHRSEGLLDSCSQGLDRPCTVSPGVLRGIEPRLKDFHQLLLSPPKVGVLSRGDLVGGVAGEVRTSCVARNGGHTQAPSAECLSSLSGGLGVVRFTDPQMTPAFW